MRSKQYQNLSLHGTLQNLILASLRSDDGRHLGRQAEVKLPPELIPAAVVVRFPAVAALSVT